MSVVPSPSAILRCAIRRDDPRWADRGKPGEPAAEDRGEVQAGAVGSLMGRSAGHQYDCQRQRHDKRGRGCDEATRRATAADARGSCLGAIGVRLSPGSVLCGRLDDVVNCGGPLAPEIGRTSREAGRAVGQASLRLGRHGRSAEGHEVFVRAEPVARKANDLAGRLLRFAQTLGMRTVLHPVADLSSGFLACRPDGAVVYASISTSCTQLATI
jgi:hypothetical protein